MSDIWNYIWWMQMMMPICQEMNNHQCNLKCNIRIYLGMWWGNAMQHAISAIHTNSVDKHNERNNNQVNFISQCNDI